MIKGMKFKAKTMRKYEKENKTNLAALIGEVLSGLDGCKSNYYWT